MLDNQRFIYLTLVFLSLFSWTRVAEATADSVMLKDNAYSGIVIAINPAIPENFTLLNQLRADVLVTLPDPVHRNEPYTVQTGQCGDPGTHIFLTPEYIVSKAFVEDFGPKGKTIVHEWAHLRWGVFDEVSRNPINMFYLGSGGKVEATRCPLALEGENLQVDYSDGSVEECKYDSATGLPTNATKCQFLPYLDQPEGLTTSLMSHHNLETVDFFCHNNSSDPLNVHNTEAPNDQNRLCGQRSTWEVILASRDFANNNNPPNPSINTLAPAFRVVKPFDFRRFVLVLDVSGSMRGDRMVQMRQVVGTFVRQFVAAGDHVGIVQFSHLARVRAELTRVETSEDREALLVKVPKSARGATCIGCGIISALKVMDNQSPDSCGEIIVFTDGEETRKPYVESVTERVIKKKCKMNTIFFTTNGNAALQNLVKASGGQWFFGNVDDLTPMIGAFGRLAYANDGDATQETSEIFSNSTTVNSGESVVGDVIIDATIGNETTFSFTWSSGEVPLEILITAPSRCVFSTNPQVAGKTCTGHPLASVNVQDKTVIFRVPGTAVPGVWRYEVTVITNQTVSVTVSSKLKNTSAPPIVVKSGMSKRDVRRAECTVVWARITVGGVPFTGAKVVAQIEKPDRSKDYVDLFDKGAAPDSRRNDGIYSRCFQGYTVRGRYSLRVSVKGQGGNIGISQESVDSHATFNPGYIYRNGSITLNKNGERNRPLPPKEDKATVDSSSIGDFTRIVTSEGFSFDGVIVNQDVDETPPSKISDLEVQQKNLSDPMSGVALFFSAPGDDYDSGTVMSYEVRYSVGNQVPLATNFELGDAVTDLKVTQGSLTSPKVAGEGEELQIVTPNLPENQEVIKIGFAVRAIDEAGNIGKPSNIAVLNLYVAPPAVPTLPPEVQLPTTTSTAPVTSTALSKPKHITPRLIMRQTARCSSLYTTAYLAAFRMACRYDSYYAKTAGCLSARRALHWAAPNYRELCNDVDYMSACRKAYNMACQYSFCITCHKPYYRQQMSLYRQVG